MPIVKVWNKHDREHVEKFKGQELRIPAGGYIEMDYLEAHDFKGQFFGMKMLGPNNPDPKCFKMIEVDEPTEPVVKPDPNMFHATGKAGASAEDVMAMAKALAAINPDLVARDEQLDRKDSTAALQAELAALKAQVAALSDRKKPGPKPKDRASA